MRSKALAMAIAAAFAAGILGCSSDEKGRQSKEGEVKPGPKAGRYKIAFLMTLDNPYWQNTRLGAMDEANKLGADVTIYNAKEDPVIQIQQIQEVIANQFDAVCLVPMQFDALVPGVQALNRARIPVIVVNRRVGEGCDYVCYTGTDTYQGAVTSAEILMKAIGGEGGVVELHQHLGTDPEIKRTKALRDVIQKYPKVKILARVPHEGKQDKAVTATQTLLDKWGKELKGIYAHGDDFAIAAADACIQAGRTDIAVVGMGGSEEAIKAIKAGKITGTSFQQPEEEGRRGIRLAIRHLKGETLPKEDLIACPAITQENADQFKGQF